MRGMRIDGSGGGAWHRDREVCSFGSKAWRDYHGVSSGALRARHDSEARHRALADVQDLADRQEARDLAALEAEMDRLAQEYQSELDLPPARWNRRSTEAMIVRVSHAGLTEAQLVALIGAGWRWSHRRGGMWWTARNEQACCLAASVCAPRVTEITE